jgi:hypothetical protein
MITSSPTFRRWFDICILAAAGLILFKATVPVATSAFIRSNHPRWYAPWFVGPRVWLVTVAADRFAADAGRLLDAAQRPTHAWDDKRGRGVSTWRDSGGAGNGAMN